MHVRRAEPADAPAIGEVHVASWNAAYRGIMDDDVLDRLDADDLGREWGGYIAAPDTPDDRLWVLVDDDENVVGYARTGPARDADLDPNVVAEVYGFYLHPDRWGRGGGRTLMEHSLNDLARRGWIEAVLGVVADNERARRFYERAGWRLNPGHFGSCHGALEVRYRRWLG